MLLKSAVFGLLPGIFFLSSFLLEAQESIQPVTPNPSPEAVNLLQYLYSISGKHTLTGQHCVPLVGSTRLAAVHKQTNRYPALFGQDFGFSPPGTWDGINYRQQIVDEAIRRSSEGFIITLMWHAINPSPWEKWAESRLRKSCIISPAGLGL